VQFSLKVYNPLVMESLKKVLFHHCRHKYAMCVFFPV